MRLRLLKAIIMLSVVYLPACSDSPPKPPQGLSDKDLDAFLSQKFSTQEDVTLEAKIQADTKSIEVSSFSMRQQPKHGRVEITNEKTGQFLFTPEENFSGADSFTFTASGPQGEYEGSAQLTVSAVNDAPIVNNLAFDTTQGQGIEIKFDAQDVDSEKLEFRLENPANQSTLTLADPSQPVINYVPKAAFFGADSFTIIASDGESESIPATVVVNVRLVNQLPIANAASFSTPEDADLGATLSGSDPESSPITFSIVTFPQHGTLTLSNPNTGAFIYDSVNNYFGSDSFTFSVNDGTNSSVPATVSITVSPVNDAPVAVNTQINTAEDAMITGPLQGSDPDGTSGLTFSIVTGATKGLIEIINAANGTYRYTPNANVSGSDSFTFRISDGSLQSNVATGSIQIASVNDPPSTSNASFTVSLDETYAGQMTVSDIDSSSFTFSIVTPPTKGNLSVNNATGAYTYFPNTVQAPDSFTFKVNDGSTDSNTATISITKTGSEVIGIAGGGHVACALFKVNKAKCWGLNSQSPSVPYGSLGTGDLDNRGDNANEMGANLGFINLGGGRTIKSLAADYNSCAIMDNDRIKCWGWFGGALGYGDRVTRGDDASEMGDNLQEVDLGTSGGNPLKTKKIFVGKSVACAILENDRLKCWGLNTSGVLGLGNTQHRGDDPGEMGDALPFSDLGTVQTVKQVVIGGSSHVCAILTNDLMKCWGGNAYGQLGIGDTQNRGDNAGEMGTALPYVVGLGTVSKVSAGILHTCAVSISNNQVKCWGNNERGQLGMGDVVHRGGTVDDMNNLTFLDMGTGRSVKQIASGGYSNCAILDNNSVKCWGYNAWGYLGIGNTADRGDQPNEMGNNLSAVNLGTGRSATQIIATLGEVCAYLDNKTVKCWGYGDYGTLGQGSQASIGDGSGEMGDTLPAIDF